MKEHIIYAEEGKEFQEYCYTDGTKVKQGEAIGKEIFVNEKYKLILNDNIRFLN